jgi:L-threonylcarbamoyladenylate synthase
MGIETSINLTFSLSLISSFFSGFFMQGSFSQLVAAATKGLVVSFPTDTVPAIAVQPAYADQIYQVKQRSIDKPLILLAAHSNDLWPFIQGNSAEQEVWQQVVDRYWPGALTIVLPASNKVPMGLSQTNTIGLRVPNCAIARKILEQTGALATSSANLSGSEPLCTMAAVNRAFPGVLALDTEYISTGQPSTVICWQDNSWQIIRQGAVNFDSVI